MDGKENPVSDLSVEIQPFNVREASHAEYTALHQHNNRIRLERLPNDPPIPLDEMIRNVQSLPPFVDVPMWVIWTLDRKTIIAQGNLVLMRMEDNQHMAQLDISVAAEYRRG